MESIEDDFSLGLRDDDGDDVAHYTTQQRTVTFSRAGSNSVTQKPRQKGPMDVYLTLDPEISVQKNKGKQKRMHSLKSNLQKIFNSDKWFASKWAKEARSKKVMEVILMPSFWNHMVFALKVSSPLVCVLHLVDGERKPPMGYIYEAMDMEKKAIAKSFEGNEQRYEAIFKIIDNRWNVQLHHPLHAARCNEWLIGRIDDHDDREDETVFSDDDGLTWNDVARAAEVGELSYWVRSKAPSSSTPRPRVSQSQLPDCSSHPPPPPPSLRPPHLAPLCPPSMALLALSLHYPSLSLPHLHHHHGFGFLHRLLGCYLNSGPGPGSNLGPSLGLSLGLSPGLDSSIGLDQSQRRMTKRKS
ncbi:hypothetical protein QYF36_000367 [Acer negundo]|nr:hypothetical protein QYF36_000367 [Acer negundo]